MIVSVVVFCVDVSCAVSDVDPTTAARPVRSSIRFIAIDTSFRDETYFRSNSAAG